MTQGWPVHQDYEVSTDDVIVPIGQVSGYWAPGLADSSLVDALVSLAGAKTDRLLAWSRERGAFGIVHPDWRGPGEPVALIRSHLIDVRSTKRLFDALEQGDLRGVGALVKAAAGHLVDPQRLATRSSLSLPNQQPARHRSEAYLTGLNGLGTAIAQGLQDTVSVEAFVTGAGDDIRLTGALAGHGPIATAYLYLLGASAALRVNARHGTPRMEWRMPRQCAKCGNPFEPKRYDAAWCSERCRWLASKQGVKNPYREVES
jgi:hypothetical protein